MSYFLEPFHPALNKIRLKLNLVNYVTKYELKNAVGADTSEFAKETDLASLKLKLFLFI